MAKTKATCPKCSKQVWDGDNVNIASANTGLIFCTNCGCTVGVVGGPFHWNLVNGAITSIRNDVARIKVLVEAMNKS
jgi:hypothetical protein